MILEYYWSSYTDCADEQNDGPWENYNCKFRYSFNLNPRTYFTNSLRLKN